MSEPFRPDASGIDPDLARLASGLTVGDLFARHARYAPERVALEQDGRRLSYGELDARVDRLANALSARGAARGERVAVLSENRLEYVELLLACAKLGAIACCQNWRQAEGELRHCLDLVSPRLTLVSPRYAELAGRLDPGPGGLLTFGAPYEAALAEAAETPPEPAPGATPEPEDGLVILYTSGTTGLPKGALISHRAEIARAQVAATDLPTEADEAFVAWAPMFHMVSADTVLAVLMQGGKVVVMDGFDAPALARIVTRERIGRLTLMPGMIGPFIEAMQAEGRPAAGVRYAGVMADLVPREQIAEVTRLLGAPYLNSFGATETGASPASAGRIEVGVAPRSLEKTQSSWCRVRLVDAEDREVPDGEPGEMTLRGPALFSGYWNAPETNAEDFRGGWFHMGDVFRREPDGALSFVDRRKYLIKSGGENIYPAEIERVLLADPRVADACVVRRADDRWGEVPVAVVVPVGEAPSARDLLDRLSGEIARYKLPKEIRFVAEAELPRSTTGKIKRHELEERLAAQPAERA